MSQPSAPSVSAIHPLVTPEPPASAISRFLWRCAGADVGILNQCPNSDRVKYQGLGGIVLATSVLAFFSSAYAFYTVFCPKDQAALDRLTDIPTAVKSLLAGFVWALVIFNLDRFIVSSTGKGDGTEKITLQEFVNALPRLAMGVVISLTLSKPLEIRVLQSEIDAQLQHDISAERDQFNAEDKAGFDKRRAEAQRDIDEAQKEIDHKEKSFSDQRRAVQELETTIDQEVAGKVGSGMVGFGPAYQREVAHRDQLKADLATDQESSKDKLIQLEDQKRRAKEALRQLEVEEQGRGKQNLVRAQQHDGLLARIQISEKIGGNVSLFITLLILAIELSPIFFKLMMTKGVYDALVEDKNLLIKAQYGIESDAELFRDSKNHEEWRDKHHRVNSVVAEERRRAESEYALATKAHAELVKKVSEEIQKDPEKFRAPE